MFAIRHPQRKILSANSVNPSRSTSTDKSLSFESLRHRAKAIKELAIEYIASDDFGQRRLDKQMLSEFLQPTQIQCLAGGLTTISPTMPAYVARLYKTQLLSKEEEKHLFRQMNYLKHRADRLRKKLSLASPMPRLMDQIQLLLQRSDQVKGRIIQANLRLVVSIAKKFVDAANGFDELVSDGNLSLIRAVEKFNYSLGNRFSTYATYAIRRNYFRTVVRAHKLRNRFLSDEEGLQEISARQHEHSVSPRLIENLNVTFGRLLERLNERERIIIRERFGFAAAEPKTFKELGDELGVCKERIRQIQARAMEKLRKYAVEERLLQQYDDDAEGVMLD